MAELGRLNPVGQVEGDRPDATKAQGSPREMRRAIRAQLHNGPTAGCAPGFLQGNLAILPQALAMDFFRYCQRNPKPCPIIGVSEPGSPVIAELGDDLDIRSDVPAYRVLRNGRCDETLRDLTPIWRDDYVTFVLGCSFSFEESLSVAGIPVRHLDAGCNVPMYRTSIMTVPAGCFSGPLVVSMRALHPGDAIEAILLSEHFRLAHGAPVHIGDPARIGITDLEHPDFGDAPIMDEGDIPLFWACGVTPQLALRNCGAEIVITHEPGHMLITDVPAAAAETWLFNGRATRKSKPMNRG